MENVNRQHHYITNETTVITKLSVGTVGDIFQMVLEARVLGEDTKGRSNEKWVL